MIKDYYEGLRQAAEIPPLDKQIKMYINLDPSKTKMPENVAIYCDTLKRFYLLWYYVYNPMINMHNYMAKNKFEPLLYNEWFKQGTDSIRSVKYRAHEIYSIISKINPKSAAYVLGKITDEIGSYEQLCVAIENQNEDLFLEIIHNGNCHITDNVNNLCFYFGNTEMDVEPVLKGSDSGNIFEDICNKLQEFDLAKSKFYSEIPNLIYETQEISDIDIENDDGKIVTVMNKWISLVSIACKWLYYNRFYGREYEFAPREKAIIDSVTKRPEVAKYFEQWRQEYDNEEDGEHEESGNVKASKPLGCWIVNGTMADTIAWGSFIKESIWDGLYKQVGMYDLPEKTPLQMQKHVSRLCAALIYKAAEQVNLAKPYLTTDGIGVSVETTIKTVIGIQQYRRQDMGRYMTMLDTLEKMEDCKKKNNFNRRLSNVNTSVIPTDDNAKKYREIAEELDSEDPKLFYVELRGKDKDMAHILLHNYEKINENLRWISSRLKKKMP